MSSYPSFQHLADQISNKKLFQQIISQQLRFFQITPYKIEKLYPETAKKIYNQILNKYEVTEEFKTSENTWQENQRRVFVWYIVILMNLYCISPQRSNQIKWDQLSYIFFNKNPEFLEFQFTNILKTKQKISWTQQEDNILLVAMSKQKLGKWNEVSKRIFYQSKCKIFKSPKHCRQRWFNHLDQTKNKGFWTLQEDYTIFKFIIENGKRWAFIVKQLQNSRTEHMIKNRYNSLISKFKKNKKKREEQIAQIVFRGIQRQLKQQKKQKKVRNQQVQIKINVQQDLPLKNQQNQNIQNLLIIQEQKSENSTVKQLQVKQEQQQKQNILSEQFNQINQQNQQKNTNLNIFQTKQSHKLIENQYMNINSCQFLYYFHPPTTTSIIPMVSYYLFNYSI